MNKFLSTMADCAKEAFEFSVCWIIWFIVFFGWRLSSPSR